MNLALTDIPYNLAYAAHYSTSFSPEKRATQEQANYYEHMQTLIGELTPFATTDAQKATLEVELERYRAKYIQLYSAKLSAQSRTMSAMITGPSNFPVRRNQKALNVEHNRSIELTEWQAKARKAIKSKICPNLGVISSDDPDAIKKLEAKVESLERMQTLMKSANSIVRNKKLTGEQKIAAMIEVGLSEVNAREALEPDSMGRLGFPGYALTNNNATIKTAKGRIKKLKAEANDTNSEIEISGIKILDNVVDNRVQILFPVKPNEDTRKQLKSHGFKWAPSNSAWQRMRSYDAMRYAKEIVSRL